MAASRARARRSAAKTSRRSAAKRDGVVAMLRERILRGELAPGGRLPTRRQLIGQLRVAPVTLQLAFDKLRLDGFVTTRGRAGTFVAAHPPSLHCFALVFPCSPSSESWSLFYTSLIDAARAIEEGSPTRFRHHYDVRPPVDGEPCRALLADMAAGRLAGIVFCQHPYELIGTPLLADDGLPRVAVMSEPNSQFPHVPAVYPDIRSFIDRALEFLAGRGRRRAAMMTLPHSRDEWLPYLAEAARRLGIETRPRWVHGVPHDDPTWASNTVQLLLAPEQPDRPDALIVADEHILPHAAVGLVAAGARAPEDIEVVVHANFPTRQQVAIPVTRIGFESRQILEICLKRLAEIRRGARARPKTSVAARLEGERGPSPAIREEAKR